MIPASLAASVGKGVPMVSVPDVEASLEWYLALGFTELGRFGECGGVDFAMVRLGKAELMLVPELFQGTAGTVGAHDVSFWLYTDQVDALYAALKATRPDLEYVEEIYDTFYGAREFGIKDLNGYVLYFIQTL